MTVAARPCLRRAPGQGLKAVLVKTAADQLIWAPIMTCVFFAVLKTLEGHPELILGTVQVPPPPLFLSGAHLFAGLLCVGSSQLLRILTSACRTVALLLRAFELQRPRPLFF